MIKLIIFDLWHTLAYKDVDYSTVSKILSETKINIPKHKFVKVFEESIQTKKWSSKFKAYANLCQNMGLEPSEKNVNLVMGIREEAEAKTKLYPHTISMLKHLRKKGYQIGLLSNSSTFAIKNIKQKTNLLDYIDYPVFSFDVGVIKPNLQMFQEMLKLTKCSPLEALMIGDKFEDDIVPAKKIGMNAILFKNYEQLKKEFSYFGIRI